MDINELLKLMYSKGYTEFAGNLNKEGSVNIKFRKVDHKPFQIGLVKEVRLRITPTDADLTVETLTSIQEFEWNSHEAILELIKEKA
jgi:hypothetical protein